MGIGLVPAVVPDGGVVPVVPVAVQLVNEAPFDETEKETDIVVPLVGVAVTPTKFVGTFQVVTEVEAEEEDDEPTEFVHKTVN
jgi:hypothetical protein